MKQGLRQSMAALHTWAGLLAGWLLFAVFLTGTASYFREEITLWMQPEIGLSRPVSQTTATAVAVARLTAIGDNASRWMIDLPTARDPSTTIYVWRPQGQGRPFQKEILDAAGGTPIKARQTAGGDFLYYFHYDLYMPWRSGRFLVCTAAIIMLVAFISGVITHRRIFADFFTFRPGKAQRSWLDAHNALGVLTLPFLVMITYSGLITLIPLYMPWGITAAYPEGPQAFTADLFDDVASRKRQAVAAPLAPVASLVATASQHWPGGSVGRIIIHNPGDRGATIRIVRSYTDTISIAQQAVTFDGVTGTMLSASQPPGPAVQTRSVLYGLHLARFSDVSLRWLFFVSGLAGTAMVATGLVLWVVKRRRKQAGRSAFGHRLVEALNVAAVTGLIIAIGAYFWSNRLVPPGVTGRPGWEVVSFFLAWLGAAVHAACRRPTAAWRDQLWIGAILFAGLPVINALTTNRALPLSLIAGDWLFAGFDLVAIVVGVALALTARRLHGTENTVATTPPQAERDTPSPVVPSNTASV